MFQLTAPIQPGSSGSPVFDTLGNVIGVVTPTLDAVDTAKRTGTVPQDVNFAVKADYLALLLKRIKATPGSFKSTCPHKHGGPCRSSQGCGRPTEGVPVASSVKRGVDSLGRVGRVLDDRNLLAYDLRQND
jgi:S1-C subfamily serine protease